MLQNAYVHVHIWTIHTRDHHTPMDHLYSHVGPSMPCPYGPTMGFVVSSHDICEAKQFNQKRPSEMTLKSMDEKLHRIIGPTSLWLGSSGLRICCDQLLFSFSLISSIMTVIFFPFFLFLFSYM